MPYELIVKCINKKSYFDVSFWVIHHKNGNSFTEKIYEAKLQNEVQLNDRK